MFYQDGIRPLTERDVRSLSHPGAITTLVEAYNIGAQLIIKTDCPRIASSRRMFHRLSEVELPDGLKPLFTIEPIEALDDAV
jgi:hypothetical protein